MDNVFRENCFCFSYFLAFWVCIFTLYPSQSWRSGTKCDCKTDWLRVRSSLEEMKYLLKFIFLRSGVEVKRGVEFCLNNGQCLQNSAESGERSILTLGSLCLPCCERDTAWSWFSNKKYFYYCPFKLLCYQHLYDYIHKKIKIK